MPIRIRTPRSRFTVSVGLAATLLIASCAGKDQPTATADKSDSSSSQDAGEERGLGSNPTATTQPSDPLPEPVQQLEFDASEYTFAISPDPSAGIRPGWTLINFHNIGAEPHQVMFARLKDGVDMAELAAAGANDSSGAGAIAFVDMIGGVSYIDAANDTTALVHLPEGTVMAMCYVPDAKGVAHALMGMSTVLNVSATAAVAATTPPALTEPVLGSIEMTSEGYQLPARLTTGWYHVKNTDTALHELALMRLAEPIPPDEVEAFVADLANNIVPDIELDAVGGMGAMSAGFDGYLHLNFEPGHYLAVDFMPDPGDPRPHMLDGYYRTFTVEAS